MLLAHVKPQVQPPAKKQSQKEAAETYKAPALLLPFMPNARLITLKRSYSFVTVFD